MDCGLGMLSGDFQIKETQVALTTSYSQVVAQDGTRWAILFSCPPSTACQFSTQQLGAGAGGLSISTNTGFILLNFRDLGGLINVSWFARTIGAPGTATVIEVLYRPSGCTDQDQQSLIDLASRMKGRIG